MDGLSPLLYNTLHFDLELYAINVRIGELSSRKIENN